MNIRTRTKTPFSAIAAIEPRPVKRVYSSYSEKYLAEKMRATVKAEGHRKALPKSVEDRMGNLPKPQRELKPNSNAWHVMEALKRLGPSTPQRMQEDIGDLSSKQVSTALRHLLTRGQAEMLSREVTQNGIVTMWGAVDD